VPNVCNKIPFPIKTPSNLYRHTSPAGGSGLCKERISEQVLHDVKISVSGTPTKIRRGVPVWFRGKLSPAFDNHWFCPGPPKKKGKPAVSYDKVLFPACASTSKWRELHRRRLTNWKSYAQTASAPKQRTPLPPSSEQTGVSLPCVAEQPCDETLMKRTTIKKVKNNK
jgi:hypothetical protein